MRKTSWPIAIVATGALLAAGVAGASAADETPPAAPPAPTLAVSDKAPLGCCCISQDAAGGAKPACDFGLSEDKCHVAGHVLPKWGSTWTPGKCPAP